MVETYFKNAFMENRRSFSGKIISNYLVQNVCWRNLQILDRKLITPTANVEFKEKTLLQCLNQIESIIKHGLENLPLSFFLECDQFFKQKKFIMMRVHIVFYLLIIVMWNLLKWIPAYWLIIIIFDNNSNESNRTKILVPSRYYTILGN